MSKEVMFVILGDVGEQYEPYNDVLAVFTDKTEAEEYVKWGPNANLCPDVIPIEVNPEWNRGVFYTNVYSNNYGIEDYDFVAETLRVDVSEIPNIKTGYVGCSWKEHWDKGGVRNSTKSVKIGHMWIYKTDRKDKAIAMAKKTLPKHQITSISKILDMLIKYYMREHENTTEVYWREKDWKHRKRNWKKELKTYGLEVQE